MTDLYFVEEEMGKRWNFPPKVHLIVK